MVTEKSNLVKKVSHSREPRLNAKGKRRKAKTPAQRRYWLDVGKAISLELIAAKYDQADAGGDGAQ